MAHVNANDEIAHLPHPIKHLHIGYTQPNDSSAVNVASATKSYTLPSSTEKTKPTPTSATTTAVAENNVATLLAHAEAKQANRSTVSNESTINNKSVNAHLSSLSSSLAQTGTNVDIKGRVANLA